MRSELRPALVMMLAMTLITGIAYPLLVTGIARLAFPTKAQGSLIRVEGRAVGASVLLRDNLLIYGLGGIVAPFIGIKAIDLALVALGLV